MTATSKRPLQVGDRVKVFCHLGDYKGTVIATDMTSTNRYRVATGLIQVKSDIGEVWTQHPRQCVLLKKKAKPERLERWINAYADEAPSSGFAWISSVRCLQARLSSKKSRLVHLVEVRANEEIVIKGERCKCAR